MIKQRDAEILEEVKNSKSGVVKVAGVDLDGILRGKYMAKDKFFSAVKNGFGFCSVIFGWDSGGMYPPPPFFLYPSSNNYLFIFCN